ncbi:MAG: Ppx/GppA family phosphatase [Candidatus Binataceae bacterium]|nr:Ppx/GppA family phosphatase [Candidatus Binataceae bacterium]
MLNGSNRRRGNPPTKVAAIDIGSNSIHMVTARVLSGGQFEIVDRAKEMVGLGRGTLVKGYLSHAAIEAGFGALSKFTQLARREGADPILAIATSSIREASNGGDFVLRAWEELGLRVDVVTGLEEARLVFEGARHSIDFRGQRPVITDVGGGSVEVIQSIGPRIEWQESLKLGVARLTDRFISSDPPKKSEIAALRSHARRKLASAFKKARRIKPTMMVGTSGTLLNLTAMAAALRGGKQPETLNNLVLRLEDLRELTAQILGRTAEERADLVGLDRRRVDLIPAGAVLTQVMFEGLEMEQMRACEWGLREGVILDFLARFPDYAETVERLPDIRRRSVIEMTRRFESGDHAAQVAKLAVRLFDATSTIHRYGSPERELLEFAALLHDVGLQVSHRRHHHHSQYLISYSEILRGFTPEETQAIAVLARFHKGALPKLSSPELSEMSAGLRQRLIGLAAILRIADALDRSHHSVVRAIRVTRGGAGIVVALDTQQRDAELELWAAERKSDLWEKLFGNIQFRIMNSGPRRRPAGESTPFPLPSGLNPVNQARGRHK